MGRLTVTWSEPGGPARLWVFGLVVDARALGAGRFVVGHPCGGAPDIDVPVVPLAGLAVAGVVAVAADCRPGGRSDRGACARAARALDDLVTGRVTAAALPRSADVRDLGLRIEQDVRDGARPGAACVVTLDGPTERAVDLAVAGRRAWATLRYRT
ncbi:MAG TPA: hypothetical protein VKB57_27120 [Acidimicrobiales bacterium]|nr:hypothetical protein [Acidimicrobiales bacterium]